MVKVQDKARAAVDEADEFADARDVCCDGVELSGVIVLRSGEEDRDDLSAGLRGVTHHRRRGLVDGVGCQVANSQPCCSHVSRRTMNGHRTPSGERAGR